MESKGKVISIARDMDGGVLLTTSLNGANWHELESLDKNTDYRIKIEKWRNKRSLDANNYCWLLCSKIAAEIRSSKEEVYEQMLKSYGCVDEEFPPITVISTADMSRIEGHWLKIRETEQNGKMFSVYLRIKGSSEYDTKQMSTLIDGVVSEAKDLGIETLPPHELERMKEQWNVSCATDKRQTDTTFSEGQTGKTPKSTG